MPFLPPELVREIIAYLFVVPHAPADEFRANSKPKWPLIHPLVVASRAYRALTLETWFRVLFTTRPDDLDFLLWNSQNLPEVLNSWTRELHCVPSYPVVSDWTLGYFRRLEKIQFDCPNLPGITSLFHFVNVPSTIVELDLRGHPRPSPNAVFEIADVFPSVETLRLSQRYIWCGLCNTCCDVRFVEPVPPKLVYKRGLGLPIHYARGLSTLEHLHTVCITLPYMTGNHIAFDSDDPGKDLWSGECDSCVDMMYGDEDFRARWTARKRGVHSAGARQDPRQVYIKPPALQVVEWNFWRTDEVVEDWEEDNEEEEEDDEGDLDEEDDP